MSTITVSGQALRLARLRAGLSVAEVARIAGCNPNHMYRLESGAVQPKPGLLVGLARALGVKVDDLLTIDEPAPAPEQTAS